MTTDALPIVSLTVGIFSILLAIASIGLSWWINHATTRVLSDIDKSAAVIDQVVRGTQDKLVDTLSTIAAPPKASQEELLYGMLGPIMANNPALLERLIETGKQIAQDEESR